MNRCLTLMTLVLPLWSGVAAGDDVKAVPDSIEVKFNYKVGETSGYRITTKSVGSMKMLDPMPEQKFSQTFGQDIVYKCIEVNPDGSGVFEVSMPRMSMDMTIGGMTFSSSSDRAEVESNIPGAGKIMASILKPMTQLRFKCTVGADGKPIKVEGLSDGLKKIFEAMPDDDISAFDKQFASQFGQYVSDDQMTENINWGYRVLPQGKVRVGDTWEHNWDQDMPMFHRTFLGHGTYELVSIEEFRGRQCAKIKVKEDMTTAPTAEGNTASGSGRGPVAVGVGATSVGEENKGEAAEQKSVQQTILEKMEFDIQMTGGGGLAYVDIHTWEIVQLRQVQDLTIQVNLPADPDAAEAQLKQGLKMTQKLKTSVAFDRIEDPSAAQTQPGGSLSGEASR